MVPKSVFLCVETGLPYQVKNVMIIIQILEMGVHLNAVLRLILSVIRLQLVDIHFAF